VEWIHGTTPGVTSRRNHYDLCFALEMDYYEMVRFFQKTFLTIPHSVKNRNDAIYMYAFYHKKPYATVSELLEKSAGAPLREDTHTTTSQIYSKIMELDDDAAFLEYVSRHCYPEELCHQHARDYIKKSVAKIREDLAKNNYEATNNKASNSEVISTILGYRYQNKDDRDAWKNGKKKELPKRFKENLPTDVTLGKILNDESVSYELLRKTVILMKFYDFYNEISMKSVSLTDKEVHDNLNDFMGELNGILANCGFAQIYVVHPFDCLIIYCANSYESLETLSIITSP